MTLNSILAQNPEHFYTFAENLFRRTMPESVLSKIPTRPKADLVSASADIVSCLITLGSAEEKNVSVCEDLADDMADGLISGKTAIIRLTIFDLMHESGNVLDSSRNRLSENGHKIAISTFLEIGNLLIPFNKSIADDFLRFHECLVNYPRATNTKA